MNQEHIYLAFLVFVYFEGTREYFTEALYKYAFFRKTLVDLKEKNYFKYSFMTHVVAPLYPLLKFKVIVALFVLYLHHHVLHSLVETGDVHYLEALTGKAENWAFGLAGIVALITVLLSPPLESKEAEEQRAQNRAREWAKIKVLFKKTLEALWKRLRKKR